MKELIQAFASHLKLALEIGGNTQLNNYDGKISNVLITGLGGSGIGGSIVAQLTASNSKVPFTVNKDYSIPEFVNEETLVIACSYSGNTEETLSALAKAEARNAEIACLTSGGKLNDIATEKGYNKIVIPDGYPPRAAFGLAFPQLYRILSHYNIIDATYLQEISNVIALLSKDNSVEMKAKNLAEKMIGKTPIIYTTSQFEGIGIRFRQQINENAKMLCWHHALPEMNHNELLGWKQINHKLAVIFFRNKLDFPRNQRRIEFTKTVLSEKTDTIIEEFSQGETALENALYFIHLGDWVSFYLSEIQGIDPVEIDVLNRLKRELANS